jgi:UDP-MurNAc hydroxylase
MIKTTLVGHACLLIQSKETTILTDPVWFDYLWEEINTLCPSIVLEKDKVPPLDVLNISHRHQDHFDVRTLAYLVKNERILTPDTLDILNELEFKNIKVVTDFESIQVKDVTITPTPSRNQLSTAEDSFPEHGLLVNDGEVTIWNQVDSLVNPDIIQQIGELYGQIDFFHSRFVPLIEGNFSYNKPITLPTDEYCTFLNVVKALGPRFVVPGSAAFRYRDELTFLNQYSFPTTQDQFLSDLALFCPEVPCAPFFSGDVAHISSDKIHIEKQASDFVRVKEDDSHLVTFKPNSEVPPIKTQTTDPEEYKREMKVVDDFIENCLLERVLSSELLEGWQHWQIVYQLEVFGQDGPQAWTIDFGQPGKPRLHKGEIGKINLYEGISSAELCALVEGNTSWDYVTLCGNYRTFNNIYRITDGRFELPPEDKSNYALEPLMDIFPWDSDMDRRKFMRDVKRWKDKPVR